MQSVKIFIAERGTTLLGQAFDLLPTQGADAATRYLAAGFLGHEAFTPQALDELLKGSYRIERPGQPALSGFDYQQQPALAPQDFARYATAAYLPALSAALVEESPSYQFVSYYPAPTALEHRDNLPCPVPTPRQPWHVSLRYDAQVAQAIPAALRYLVQDGGTCFLTGNVTYAQAEQIAVWAQQTGVFEYQKKADAGLLAEASYA